MLSFNTTYDQWYSSSPYRLGFSNFTPLFPIVTLWSNSVRHHAHRPCCACTCLTIGHAAGPIPPSLAWVNLMYNSPHNHKSLSTKHLYPLEPSMPIGTTPTKRLQCGQRHCKPSTQCSHLPWQTIMASSHHNCLLCFLTHKNKSNLELCFFLLLCSFCGQFPFSYFHHRPWPLPTLMPLSMVASSQPLPRSSLLPRRPISRSKPAVSFVCIVEWHSEWMGSLSSSSLSTPAGDNEWRRNISWAVCFGTPRAVQSSLCSKIPTRTGKLVRGEQLCFLFSFFIGVITTIIWVSHHWTAKQLSFCFLYFAGYKRVSCACLTIIHPPIHPLFLFPWRCTYLWLCSVRDDWYIAYY